MKKSLLIASLLFFSHSLWSQTKPAMEILGPPTSSNPPAPWNDLFNNVLPNAAGINVFMVWGSIDNVPGGTQPCTEISGSNQCDWSAYDPILLNYIYGSNGSGTCTNGLCKYNQTKKLNLIVEILPEGSQAATYIPAYVYNSLNYSAWCGQCSSSAPQDLVTCGDWAADASAPTCGTVGSGSQQCQTAEIGIWNSTQCQYYNQTTKTWSNSCPNTSGTNSDISGYPVLYEVPLMTAWANFAKNIIKHYSSSGSGSGRTIAPYIGYIRFGLAEGGENGPMCTVINKSSGIWPNYQGLNDGIERWYETEETCQGNPPPFETDCEGKDAYLEGVTYPPGYMKTMVKAFQSYVDTYNPGNVQVVINTHTGPPFLTDPTYADTEATLIAGLTNTTEELGFGMEALSVGDPYNYGLGQECTDDWCANFDKYYTDDLNLYLQTIIPNPEPTYGLTSVTLSGTTATATCSGSCISSNGQLGKGLTVDEPIIITGNLGVTGGSPGTNGTFQIASTNLTGEQFTFSIANGCSGNSGNACGGGSGGTIETGDYLPVTIPFAASRHTDTLEIYWCDWEFAFSSDSQSVGCPAYQNPGLSQTYAFWLTNP